MSSELDRMKSFAQEMHSTASQERLDAVRARVFASQKSAVPFSFATLFQQHRAASFGSLALATGVLAFAALRLLGTTNNTTQLMQSNGSPLASFSVQTGEPARRIELSDGSSIALAENSQLRTVTNRSSDLVLELNAGEASFDVVPGGPRRWKIRTPHGVVKVRGTSFRVSVSSETLSVAVDRGHVSVRTHNDRGQLIGTELHAGDARIFRPSEETSDFLPSSTAGQNAPVVVEDTNQARAVEDRTGNAVREALPRANANDEAALAAPETSADRLSSAEESMENGDLNAARRSFEAILGDANAFEEQRYARIYLAEIALRQNDPRRAATVLDTELMASWPVSLFERGYGLLFRALENDDSRFCSVQRSYLQRRPQGLHASRLRECPE